MSVHDVIIVGGSGFVGSKLAKHLSDKFRVKIIDLKPVSDSLKEKVDFETVDIRDYGKVLKTMRHTELVIHTAVIGIPLVNTKKRLGYEVNVLGTQNVCEAVIKSDLTKGLVLTGTWHVFGERDLWGTIDEEFGCRPDKVEERARYYCLTKTVQENVIRAYDEASERIYGIVRLGTVLGEGMREKTAANTFISNAVEGKPITPYRHSMWRPMLYVDVSDACRALETYAKKILNNEIGERKNSLAHIVNVAWPNPITIFELAEIVRDAVIKYSGGKVVPKIKVVDRGLPSLCKVSVKESMSLNIEKAERFLGIKNLTEPRKSIEKLVMKRMACSRT